MRDVASVFFSLHIVSKSRAEMSTPIGAVVESHSHANLPCLVKLVNGSLEAPSKCDNFISVFLGNGPKENGG